MPSPIQSLRELAARPLARDLLKVSTGNLAGNLLNALALLLLGAAMGPAEFGVFGALQAMMVLIAQLSDFGLNTTIIKYYRDLESEGRKSEAEALLRRSLWLRVGIVGTIAGACIVWAGPLARHGLDLSEDDLNPGQGVGLVRLIALGAFGSSLWMFCQAAMQARQQFGAYAWLTTGNHALRLLLVILLIAMRLVTVPAAVYVVIAVPFMGSLGGALLWPGEFWRARMEPEALKRQMAAIFHLSKWIFLSTVTTSLIMRMDVLLLKKLSTSAETGQFNFANTLAQGFPLITAAVSTVLLPKLAATRSRREMMRIVGYFLRATPWLLGLVGALIAGAHLLIPFVRGGAYNGSIWVFDLLALGFSISIIVNPLSFFCLAFERARWLTWMNLCQLGLNAAIDVAFIPSLGALAAGIATLGVRAFALVFLVVAFRRLLRMAED